jgi:hypothetical protein
MYTKCVVIAFESDRPSRTRIIISHGGVELNVGIVNQVLYYVAGSVNILSLSSKELVNTIKEILSPIYSSREPINRPHVLSEHLRLVEVLRYTVT